MNARMCGAVALLVAGCVEPGFSVEPGSVDTGVVGVDEPGECTLVVQDDFVSLLGAGATESIEVVTSCPQASSVQVSLDDPDQAFQVDGVGTIDASLPMELSVELIADAAGVYEGQLVLTSDFDSVSLELYGEIEADGEGDGDGDGQ